MTNRKTVTKSPTMTRMLLELILALVLVWFAIEVSGFVAMACEPPTQLPAVDTQAPPENNGTMDPGRCR